MRSQDRGPGRGRTGGSTGSSKMETFRTPEMELSGNRKNTEEMRASGSEARETRGSGETLERALEKEMEEWMKKEGFSLVNPWQRELDRLKEENMDLLKRQNSKLLEKVERLRRENKLMENQQLKGGEEEVGMSDWSDVSPPIPRPESPERKGSDREQDGLRFTPGGTQVPPGPPPEETEVLDVRVPEFPWSSGGIYERVQRDPRRGAIGDWKWPPREIWGEVRGCESRSKHFGRDRLDRDEVH